VVHRVIAAHAPGVTVIDITHQIPAHDPRAGALTLWRAAPWLVPGVILAVVDPGVGTVRRAVALEVASAAAALIGPDNGLLLPAATSLGSITTAVELAFPGTAAAGRGATFAGRDLFAPAAAALAAGADLRRLGSVIDPAGLAGEPVPAPEPGPGGGLQAQVLWVDHFGNAQLNAGPADADHLGPLLALTASGYSGPVRRVAAYADLDPSEVGLVNDSYGLLAIACRDASAASRLGLRAGDPVWLGPQAGG
jgi:S-adenosyl-L-methionine hydrolase (adenosine-forming)